MKIVVFRKHTQKSSKWSGGTSSELFIHPPNASLAERNFTLRVSKATVNVSASTFTTFLDYQRNLLLLKGCLLIQRNKKNHYLLCPGDEMHFDGTDLMEAKGTCSDYNVMWKGDGMVHSQMMLIEKDNVYAINQSVGGQMLFFHVDIGKVSIEILGEEYILTEGMSLEIDAIREDLNLMIRAHKRSTLVLSEILLK